MNKQVIFIAFVVGVFIGLAITFFIHFTGKHPYDYKINMMKDYRVELIDEHDGVIATTSLDSIVYFIEQDNL